MTLRTTRIKKSDQWAYEYLVDRGFANIVYEPNGNVSPDFVVEGLIAVEARRLNQNKESANRLHGLEELWKPLQTTVTTVIESMGAPIAGSSWFVQYSFKRPLPERKDLKRHPCGCATGL